MPFDGEGSGAVGREQQQVSLSRSLSASSHLKPGCHYKHTPVRAHTRTDMHTHTRTGVSL